MAKTSGNRSSGIRNVGKGGRQSGGQSKSRGSGGLPSKTGNRSGGGRTNAPPKGK